MFLRALLAFLVLPGLAAILAPPAIAALDPWRCAVSYLGLPAMIAGAVVLLWCVRDFYVAGKGTLAPWDPPRCLVIVGLYRHVRNPMYIGVLILVLGWALTLASPLLAVYTLILGISFHLRVVRQEEPWLSSAFGESWAVYAEAVSRWFPRLYPWDGK
jgi:protein-S-isoprenylcysteine O-methyltransferase Ste14